MKTKTMKKFSIDVKASGKKEMKKARKYLRGEGFKVKKKKDEWYNLEIMNYLSNSNEGESGNYDFEYFCHQDINLLTLPKDWDKLIEYTKKEDEPEKAINIPDFYDHKFCDTIRDITLNSAATKEDAELYMKYSNDYKRDGYIVKELSNLGLNKNNIILMIRAANIT